MRLSPTIWPVMTDLNGVFCVTCTAARKDDVKIQREEMESERLTESMLLLAERHEDNSDSNSLWSHADLWLDWTFFRVGKLRDSRNKSDLPTVRT